MAKDLNIQTILAIFHACCVKGEVEFGERAWSQSLSKTINDAHKNDSDANKLIFNGKYFSNIYGKQIKPFIQDNKNRRVPLRSVHLKALADYTGIDLAELDKKFTPPITEYGLQNYLTQVKKENLPQSFKQHVTRIDFLERISKSHEEYPVTALWGLPGMGKSTLAFDYAKTYQKQRYPGGCWFIPSADDDLNFKRKIIKLAEEEWNFKFTDEENKDEQRKWRRVKLFLEGPLLNDKQHLTLLIFDNVHKPGESFSDVKIDADRLSGVDILITCREIDPESQRIRWISDKGLSDKESLCVLANYRTIPTPDEEKAAVDIVKRLDGMAMALTLVGVQLKTNIRASFADALEDLKNNGISFLDDTGKSLKDTPGHYPQKVITLLFLPILKQLEEEEFGEELVRILDYAALMPADQVALPWIEELVKSEYPDRFQPPKYKSWRAPWRQMLKKLKNLSLLMQTNVKDIVRIHRLLQEVIINNSGRYLQLKEANAELMAFAEELADSLIGNTHVHSSIGNIDVLLALAIENITKNNASSLLLNRISLLEQSLGNYVLAKDLIQKAIAMDEKSYEPDHPRLGILYSNIGMIELHLGNYLAARNLMKKAMDINQKNYD
jgi:hypothetical protein